MYFLLHIQYTRIGFSSMVFRGFLAKTLNRYSHRLEDVGLCCCLPYFYTIYRCQLRLIINDNEVKEFARLARQIASEGT